MKKIMLDTLTINGRYSQKRILAFSSFIVATIYAFMPLIVKAFDVKEFVFAGFLAIGGFTIFRIQKTNENERVDVVEQPTNI